MKRLVWKLLSAIGLDRRVRDRRREVVGRWVYPERRKQERRRYEKQS